MYQIRKSSFFLGREPINSERSADVRFGPHSGLKSDIARGQSAIGLNRSRGRALRRASNGWNDESALPDDDEGSEACPQNR